MEANRVEEATGAEAWVAVATEAGAEVEAEVAEPGAQEDQGTHSVRTQSQRT